MKKPNISILLVIIFITKMVFSQSEITGTVTDASTRESLPGASVYLPELMKGAATDSSGHFSIKELPQGKHTIEISYLGYETEAKKIILGKKPAVLNVALHPTMIRTQEVVITSSGFTTQHENAVKIETLSPEEIKSQGCLSLPAALTRIPGVDMISKGSGVVKPVIRGLSNSNVVMLYDGVKLENYQFSENHPYVIGETGIDKVEVIKGPASLLYGSDAIGGIISIIPEKPADAGTIKGDAGIGYFSNTNGYTSGIGIKGAGRKNFWGMRGSVKSHEDYKDGKGNTVYNSRFGDQNIQLNTGRRTKNGSFGLAYNYNALKAGMITPQAQQLVKESSRKNEFWYQDLTNHILHSKNKIFAGKFRVNADLAWQNNTRKLHTDEENEVFMTLNTFSWDIRSWLPAGESSDYILGIQGSYNKNENNGGHQKVLPDYSQNDIAFFGLAQRWFHEKILLQAGLRFENRNIDVPEQENSSHNHKKTGVIKAEDDLLVSLKRRYSNLSFSAGGTWQMTHFLHVRANAASGYRTPNIAELTQNGVHGNRYEAGNRDLVSQRNYETDLSLHFHNEFIETDVAGFYNRIENFIFLSPTDEFADEFRIYRYAQDNAVMYGLEAYAALHPKGGFQVSSSYAFVRAYQESGGNLPFIPQGKLNLEIRYGRSVIAKFRKTYLFAGVTAAFDQLHPSEFESETDGYFLVNAGMGFTFNIGRQDLEMAISGSNLLSEQYIDHLSTLKDMGLANMGRNFTFSLQIPFVVAEK